MRERGFGIQDKSANILQIVTKIQLKYKLVLIGLLPNPTITTGIVPNSNDKTKCTPLQGAEANQKDPVAQGIIFGSGVGKNDCHLFQLCSLRYLI